MRPHHWVNKAAGWGHEAASLGQQGGRMGTRGRIIRSTRRQDGDIRPHHWVNKAARRGHEANKHTNGYRCGAIAVGIFLGLSRSTGPVPDGPGTDLGDQRRLSPMAFFDLFLTNHFNFCQCNHISIIRSILKFSNFFTITNLQN